jgi:hypothetical protein
MPSITSINQLDERIEQVEYQKNTERLLLNEQFSNLVKGLTPLNLIKETLSEISIAPDFKANIIDSSVGLAAGYIAKKIVIGSTESTAKKIMGALLQLGVTRFVAKNNEGIVVAAKQLIHNILNRESNTEE